jgi:hypothetical protein
MTRPSKSTRTHIVLVGHAIASMGTESTLRLCQADAPPVGEVDQATRPFVVPDTHSDGDGQETVLTPDAGATNALCQAL